MSPTHTRKGGKLYRYYVSQSVLKQARDVPGRPCAGREIEAAVIDQLRDLLRPPEIVVGTWRAARAQDGEITEADVRDALTGSTRSGTNSSRPSRRASSRSSSSGSTSAPTASNVRLRMDGLSGLAREMLSATWERRRDPARRRTPIP